MAKVTVNFVTRNEDESRWSMVLVEEGPWDAESSGGITYCDGSGYACYEQAD